MNVLAGSEDVTLRRNIAYALNSSGSRVVTTGKSSALLVEVLDQDFDLVILDTEMEGMDGQETFQILRQVRPKAPVLFLHWEGEDVSNGVRTEEGRVGTLKRAATGAKLIRAVEALAARSVQKKALSEL